MIRTLLDSEFVEYNILYINDPKELYTDSWGWDYNKIQSLSKHSLVIVNYGIDDYQNSLHYAKDIFTKYNINHLLITHTPVEHYYQDAVNIIYHPYHYFQTRDTSLGYTPLWPIENISDQNINQIEKKYKLACLNGNPRPHKILNFIRLKEKSYYKDCYFTMHNSCANAWRSDDLILDPTDKVNWELLKSKLPTPSDLLSKYTPTPENCITSDAHTNSYIHLIVETTANTKYFITEKTWKVIASGQLFLILAGQGIIAHLRDAGLDTFDDIIDHNYYDSEFDTKLRIIKLHEVIDNLMQMDLKLLNEQTSKRRKKNAELFWNNKLFQSKYTVDELRTAIRTCLTK